MCEIFTFSAPHPSMQFRSRQGRILRSPRDLRFLCKVPRISSYTSVEESQILGFGLDSALSRPEKETLQCA